MTYLIKTNTTQKFLPKLIAMTPYEIYLNQVKSSIEQIRFESKGMTYFPPQLGGLTGQRTAITESVVLQTIDFEVK